MATVLGDGAATVELDEGLYPKDAVFGAAYVFIDRCYVHLDRAGDRRIKVTLRAKSPAADTKAMAGEFENELLGQAWRRQIVEENRGYIETIASRALGGAAGPPRLDDLLAVDISEESAREDPRGIAMSWEEKYTKKKDKGAAEAKADDAAPVPDAGASSKAEGT